MISAVLLHTAPLSRDFPIEKAGLRTAPKLIQGPLLTLRAGCCLRKVTLSR